MKNLMKQSIMLLALLTVTNFISAQKTTGEEMAKNVFKTIQNADVETFLTHCISEEKNTKMLNDLTGTSEMEKGLKNDLKGEDVKKQIDDMKRNFNGFGEELKKEGVKSKDGVYEFEKNEYQFEVTNLKCYDIKFKVIFDKTVYRFEINLFETKDDTFLFGFRKLK